MEPGYICLYFKQSAPDCTISPTQMRKSCSLLKSVEKRFLMYGFCPNKDGDGPRKYTLRQLQAAHRRHRSKGQILRGVQLKACFPWACLLGEMLKQRRLKLKKQVTKQRQVRFDPLRNFSKAAVKFIDVRYIGIIFT